MSRINIISAISKKDLGIGRNNDLLWRIPEDLKRFKTITSGHPVIMGENTWKSIGKSLPGRTNIVLTKSENFSPEGCVIAHSIEEATQKASAEDKEDIFFIGGAMVYKQAIEFADRLYLTIIDAEAPADTFFPNYSKFKKIIFEEKHTEGVPPYSFVVLEK